MKNTIFSFLTAAGLLFAGCHQPDELLPSVSRNGINSVTAQFVKNNSEGAAEFYGEFKGYPAEGSDEITVEIPWFYPESSDDVVSGKMLDKMRISLNLDDNVTVDPAVLYMNLNEDNYITVTDQLKQKKVYKVRGRIVKSKACLLEELSLPSQGLNAIIDQETKEVSLIAAGNIEPCTGTYRLSYHATISPDPATTVIDWNASPKLTVTAYDGVSKTVYTVKKEVPAKVPTGIRSGSQKNLFVSETFKTDYGMSGTTNYTLGILGDHLLICSGESEIVYVNKLTGVKAGTVNMGGINLGGGAITSDEANHIVMCSIAANGASQTIYRLDHVTDTPKEVMTWSNATGGKIGSKISIKGDIDADAVVTINCWAWASPANWSSFVRIIVTDGVWGTPEKVTIAGCGLWNGGNVDVEYLSTDITGPYFKASYSTNGAEWIDGATNSRVAFIDKGANDANSNFANVSCAVFNKSPFVAVFGGSHFAYSASRAILLDVGDRNLFTGTFDNTKAKIYASTPKYLAVSGTASCDILLSQSFDGYYLYLYWIGGNTNYIRAEQWDCVDK